MVKKLKFKKVVVKDWSDFKWLYPSVSLIFVFAGSIIAMFYGINYWSVSFTSVPLWVWILMYLVEVRKDTYYEEV